MYKTAKFDLETEDNYGSARPKNSQKIVKYLVKPRVLGSDYEENSNGGDVDTSMTSQINSSNDNVSSGKPHY
jgi:hypothetical protein